MANHPSALKAHRQSVRRRNRNRSNKSALRTALKSFDSLIQEGKTKEAGDALPGLYSCVDKAVRQGALQKNAAARHKSRLTQRLHKTAPEATSK
jgi:small subunit ribosomal protein S20